MALGYLLVFLPLLGGALVHAPVLRWDLLRGLKRPLDGGATVRGRRLFGDNKTWRGALAMLVGIVAATALLARWSAWREALPAPLAMAEPLLLGALLALGAIAGELPNSFLKRQLGIEPGTRGRRLAGALFFLLDQGDFVIGIWIALLPLWRMSVAQAALAFAAVAAGHAVVNVVGYAIKARRSPL